MATIFTITVVDCLNAVEDYSNFGHYVYLVDSKNDYGVGEKKVDIQQMTVNCTAKDKIYFWSRGMVPSDMPAISGMKCDICDFTPNPVGFPEGTWLATLKGNGNYPLTATMTMPDGTDHPFAININSQKV